MSSDDFPDEFEMDGGLDTTEDLDKGGGGRVSVECWGMFEISNIKDELRPEGTTQKGEPKAPSLNLTCKLMVTVPGAAKEGEVVFHRLYFGSKDRPQQDETRRAVARFGRGIGVLKAFNDGEKEITVDAETGNRRFGPGTFMKAQGWFFCAHVKINKDGYPEFSFGRDVYQIGDPAVAHVKKNWEAIADVYGQETASRLAEQHSKWLQDNPPGSEGWLKVYPAKKGEKSETKKPATQPQTQTQHQPQQQSQPAVQQQQAQPQPQAQPQQQPTAAAAPAGGENWLDDI